jgi:hypothetical protein
MLCVVRNDGVGCAIQSLTGTHKNFQFWQTSCNPRRCEFNDTFTNTQSARSAVKVETEQVFESKTFRSST